MERLSDDANSIQRLLPWISNKEDIVNFLRTIPIDHNHLKIPLSINHFFDLRDQNEENSEQNIENDAREIVILLPDIPYNLIKNRLRSLGNVSNRKEIVVRQIINDRPDLGRILQEIDSTSDRKRHNETMIDEENKETNIKIKIRKIDGSLEVVSSIKEEILRSPKQEILQSPKQEILQSPKQEILRSPKQEILQSPKLVIGVPEFCRQRSLDESASATSTKDQNKMLPSTSNTVMQKDTFNLIEYLKEVTQCSQEKIELVCNKMNVPTSERPHETLLNEVLNRLFDDSLIQIDDSVIELDGSDNDSNSDEVLDLASTHKHILKPATLVKDFCQLHTKKSDTSFPLADGNFSSSVKPITSLSIAEKQIIKPAKFDFPPRSELNRPVEVIPAIPQQFLNRINPRNNGNEEPEIPNIKEEPPSDEAFGYMEQLPSAIKKELFKAEISELPGPSNIKAEQLPGPSRTEELLQELPYNDKLVMRLMEMFPEACPLYIKNICRGKKLKHLDDVVTIILNEETYPKRPQRSSSPPKEYDIEEQLEIVKALLPDADPTYLRWKCETIGNNPVELNEFINTDREQKSYPTMKEYLRKQKLSAQSKQYTTEFNVKNFLELFPDPEKTFRDSSRICTVDNYTLLYICNFFQNRYDKLSVKCIRSTLASMNNKILLSDDAMFKTLKGGDVLKKSRKPVLLQDPPQNIAVLQELAYIRHKYAIDLYLKEKKQQEELEKKIAKENGLFNNCQCCYDEEVMPKDTFYCPKECTFCRSCIQKSCEVNLGDGKTDFKCLNDCEEEFTLHTLQEVLPPKLFSKLAQKKALAEVKAAGIGELETCPFCDFASIPNPADKIFRCLNPDCTKESCRLCKEENHIPYKCDEVERDADVKARVFVENKMTEALLRKCWQCSKSFFKEEGCNKMTCTCGAKMCYICKQPVKDYSHFNGIGGDKFNLCPLYSDTNDFNQKNVIKAAEEAKSKVDPSKLKIDPSLDVQQHYQKRKRKLPEEPHIRLVNDALRHLNNGAQVHVRRQAVVQERVAQVMARQVQNRERWQEEFRQVRQDLEQFARNRQPNPPKNEERNQ